MENVAELRPCCPGHRRCAGPRPSRSNLAFVTFIDSTGHRQARVRSRARDHQRQRPLGRECQPGVRRILSLLGLLEVLETPTGNTAGRPEVRVIPGTVRSLDW